MIALVITIIVLLILAGVTINLTLGENGIFKTAEMSEKKTREANAEEQAKLAVLGSIGTKGNIDNDKLKTNLERIENITGVPETITDEHYPLIVNIDGYDIMINKDGSTTVSITIEQAKVESMLEKSENSIIKVEDGIVIIPGEFKVAEDSADRVEDGIVIEDKNKNQFVWIPVTESEYVRNKTYLGEQLSETAVTDKDYLPDEIQPDLNGETTLEKIGAINEEAERKAVVKMGGFYIARFEAGKEETETLISKKGAIVWVDIPHEEAKERAKKMINTTHAKTALCSGIQWDVVMEFVNGKLDGATPPQTFDVRVGSDARHLGSDVTNSGANVADKVCNIYDLEGNCYEYVAEKVKLPNNGYFFETVRGGSVNIALEASSRAQLTNSESNHIVSFRTVLYVM